MEEGPSDPGFCRLRPDLLTGELSGSREPGRGWWDRGLIGGGVPRGFLVTVSPFTPEAEAVRGYTQGQKGEAVGDAHSVSYLS